MIEPKNPVLAKMLERLFAAVINGPAMNCRPHSSRQRVDWSTLSRLQSIEPGSALLELLGVDATTKLAARVVAPASMKSSIARKGRAVEPAADSNERKELSPEEQVARKAWLEQQSLLTKLRVIADDARTYEQDTGMYVLDVGFPLLSLPPGSFGGSSTRRILAPLAFIPISLTVKSGVSPTIEIASRSEGIDRVRPNAALLAWLEQQNGKPLDELFADEAGENTWREISELVRQVAARIEVPVPEIFTHDEPPTSIQIVSTPKTDDDETTGKSIVCSAVLGLFPASNQGLLRDTREMLADGAPDGPLENFVRLKSLEISDVNEAAVASENSTVAPLKRSFAAERLISQSDPCQTSAVRMAQNRRGLVIHGPPGTGKSQTIANVIGDHLARGERVLFVCDKRTALDVVADRLGALGLADLLATVHDPQRDQRLFYRSVNEQINNLSNKTTAKGSGAKLSKIDEELQTIHDDLSAYHHSLMGINGGGDGTFHHLVGLWLADGGASASTFNTAIQLDERELQSIPAAEFLRQQQRLRELLDRGEAISHADNVWVKNAGIDLATFLATPMDVIERSLNACVSAASTNDASLNARSIPFDVSASAEAVADESRNRASLADAIDALPSLPISVIEHWTKQPATARVDRIALLKDVLPLIERFSSQPLDAALLSKASALSQEAVRDIRGETSNAYAAAFEERKTALTRAMSVAGADEATALKWTSLTPAKLAAARKRLDAAAPLVAAIESGALDPSLQARTIATPIAPAMMTDWSAALNRYIDIAGSWTAIFHGVDKKAATPAVKHFGLSLGKQSATKVRDFLAALQQRDDLRLAIEAATGSTFADRPDDGELVESFRLHHAIATALTTASSSGAPIISTQLSESAIAGIHAQIPSQLAAVESAFALFALPANGDSARSLSSFIDALSIRLNAARVLSDAKSESAMPWPIDDDATLKADHAAITQLLALLERTGSDVATVASTSSALFAHDAERAQLIDALRQSPARAKQILAFEVSIRGANLFAPLTLAALAKAARLNRPVHEDLAEFAASLPTLENVLRIREGLRQLPPSLAKAAATLLPSNFKASASFAMIRRNVIAGEIVARLKSNPQLQAVDGHRLQSAFDRFRTLSAQKQTLVRDQVIHYWTDRQRSRLLASTGSRVNTLGADLRRRLTLRGEKAMRLRQVIAHGKSVEGGDPLFDLRPVWMASPETVAQLFAREPIFDVIVFDEASQCRLEEALPVLTRGKRIVIAGDGKQLPPTRFFESAMTRSDEADPEGEQELFETQQGEIEELLAAALNLSGIEECYLKVHYRSRNSDLIEFSNEHFYGSRLQAIPGHPKNRATHAPILVHRADGTYEKRANAAEAKRVCELVRELLERPQPPSIGIACFNMVQRDEIVEALEALADEDTAFATKLAEARERKGQGSSEGLFVKNLENVQGDERDHLIISTTYGPDPAGKFRRNFGPLGSAGGGRRLNVLVTRAREVIHIVTSIPRSAYASLPPVPQGTIPGGAYLLFAYLNFADQLTAEYETNFRILQSAVPAEPEAQGAVSVRKSATPSNFAVALAQNLASTSHASSEVHWGNEGFCVDVAVQQPTDATNVVGGIQCDMTRYAGTDDPVEWDIFQAAIHESQGWKLQRVWSPHFFRNASGVLSELEKEMNLQSDSQDSTNRTN